MQKEIRKNKGTFVIGYWQTSDDINIYIADNCSEPIKVFFYPNAKMTEDECENYMENYILELKNEIVNIITENQQFYKNFDISYNISITRFSLISDEINLNKLIVSDLEINPYCKLKVN